VIYQMERATAPAIMKEGSFTFKHPRDTRTPEQMRKDRILHWEETGDISLKGLTRQQQKGLREYIEFGKISPSLPQVIKDVLKQSGAFGFGGEMPPEKLFFKTAEASYKEAPPNELDGFTLVVSTPTLKAYLKDKTLLIGLRGTKITDKKDIIADIKLPLNLLKGTDRYKKDKETLQAITKRYPPQDYEYYISGHSLGGAIDNQLKYDFPFIKNAVEYNPAFQSKDLIWSQGRDIKRLYTDKDGLYNLGGKLFVNKQVIPAKSSTGLSPIDAISGHILSNFADIYNVSGGGQTASKIAGEINRYDVFLALIWALEKVKSSMSSNDMKTQDAIHKYVYNFKGLDDIAQAELLAKAKYLYNKYFPKEEKETTRGKGGTMYDAVRKDYPIVFKKFREAGNDIEKQAIVVRKWFHKLIEKTGGRPGFFFDLLRKTKLFNYKNKTDDEIYSDIDDRLILTPFDVFDKFVKVINDYIIVKSRMGFPLYERADGDGKNAGFIKMLYAKRVLKRRPEDYPTRDKKAPKSFKVAKIKNPSAHLRKKFGVEETIQKASIPLNRPFRKGERKNLSPEDLAELRRLERERQWKSKAKKEGITLEEYKKRHKLKSN